MRLTAAVFLLTVLAMPARAADEETVTWYDVEIIVFKHAEAKSTETWPPDAGLPDVENARSLYPDAEPEIPDEAETAPAEDRGSLSVSAVMPGGTIEVEPEYVSSAPAIPGVPDAYTPLPESDYQMQGVWDSLRRSSKYEPVFHVAWTQPPLEREQAPVVRINLPEPETSPEEKLADGMSEEAAEDTIFEDATAFAEPAGMEVIPEYSDATTSEDLTDESLPTEEENKPVFKRPLDGTVKLSVSQYLVLYLDLLYLPEDVNPEILDVPAATEEVNEAGRAEREERHRAIMDALARGDITLEEAEILALEPEETLFEGFRLNQSRRVRTRELHYFDHPVYGAIVTVTPRRIKTSLLESSAVTPATSEAAATQ